MASSEHKIKKLLVVNRGEIACRIFSTCRRLGITTLALYSDADESSKHVRESDNAFALGGREAKDSYLDTKKILEILKKSGADAVHPGYGFLSENPDFAEAVRKLGVIWIGPSPNATRSLGNKLEAKKLAAKAKVPVAPSLKISRSTSKNELEAFVKKAGAPLIVKAAAGGGGRGMRIVEDLKTLQSAIESARREALAAFGDDSVYLEKLITSACHIEVQLLGDAKGEIAVIGDRDCSVQRKHQKLIEEAPAPNLDPTLRKKIHSAASRLFTAAKYQNAGTAEFLVTDKAEFYFLEVNSRLQVEHTVTESVTGLDLVEMQIALAEGKTLKALGLNRAIKPAGHAIQARLCAESYLNIELIPSSGRITYLEKEYTHSTRYDFGYDEGDFKSSLYDSLIGKIIVHGKNRTEAISDLVDSLNNIKVFGIECNARLLREIINSKAFKDSRWRTNSSLPSAKISGSLPLQIGTAIVLFEAGHTLSDTASYFSFSFGTTQSREFSLTTGETSFKLNTSWISRDELIVIVDDEPEKIIVPEAIMTIGSGIREVCWRAGRTQHEAVVKAEALGWWVHTGSENIFVERRNQSSGSKDLGKTKELLVKAQLPGKIVRLNFAAGDKFQVSDTLVVLESMKMEHPIKASFPGTIKTLKLSTGDSVQRGTTIMELEPD